MGFSYTVIHRRVRVCLNVIGRQMGTYTNWASNEPATETNLCVALAKEKFWNWSDEDCNSPYPFICETGLVCHLPYSLISLTRSS